MIVSGAAKPSSKVLSLVCFSISFFNYSTKKRGAAWQMYWLCQEGMIWIWIVHKIVQLLRPHLCVNKIFASNEYWLWSRSQMMGVYCNAIFILFSRIWSHSVCLNIMDKKNKKSRPNTGIYMILSINREPIMKHSEVDQTKSTTPFSLSDFKSIPFRVCNAPYKLGGCTSHSWIISVGYYLTLPLSQLVRESFIVLIR